MFAFFLVLMNAKIRKELLKTGKARRRRENENSTLLNLDFSVPALSFIFFVVPRRLLQPVLLGEFRCVILLSEKAKR